jgi:predicted nucleotidyltransferase
MRTEIQDRLGQLGRERGIHILYACESGSRAWGFASPDSDYDVRFIYAHTPDWYLSIHNRDETIDLPLEGELDLAGWDLRKALRLFAKSNGVLLEWLHSPIVYLDTPDITTVWRSLVPDIISPKALACHYLGQCRRIWLGLLQADQVQAKHYLYALRSLLAAGIILRRRSIPPVALVELLAASEIPAAISIKISELVGVKAAIPEHARLEAEPLLHQFIELQLDELERLVRQRHGFVADRELVDAFLHRALACSQPELARFCATR